MTHRTAEENLGLGYLAAVLRGAGHSVAVVDGWLEGMTVAELAERISRHDAEIVGFACYRSNMERAMETLRLVRPHGRRPFSVAGGYGPTFHTADFLDAGFDAVVRGEGEVPLRMLVEHVLRADPPLSAIPGLSFRDEDGTVRHNTTPAPKLPMDALPDPERDTLALTLARRSLVHIQTARGCQASCTFCSIVAFERVGGGATWRQRSIGRIVDELERLYERGARHFKVIDDSLIEPPRDAEWCEELAAEIARRGIHPRLRGSIRADRVSEEVIEPLVRAGFFSFSCGIENFSSSALRRMAKRADVGQNLAALDTFLRHGLYVQAGHILFDDQTTLSELEDNYAMMRRYVWTISKGIFTEMYAAAGTNFTRKLLRRGELDIDQDVLGNTRYAVRDEVVRVVYDVLKRWHKAHAAVYDKAIDPLSAPKALSSEELRLLHGLAVELRAVDLDFFRRLLDLAAVASSAVTLRRDAEDLLRADTEATLPWYADFEARLNRAYQEVGLVYDADPNPFLC
ncbi:B12-binding domain-containing radical SAM protein [Streptoalloteichus tenebrarius]|uniref:B12-binding domain-containing radical SAM protein n=1 Tax=Streptoalloteichus tenebrarius (strain ATCC 17920 / DSM 40477 / JCM 4838 / CBS 697.72 / NBRC 16177 / NCIMB 11028 / NRRL B-12390 / A12253. 1 / ISP 5477) TaxID=1933 RepID=UPI0036D3A14D